MSIDRQIVTAACAAVVAVGAPAFAQDFIGPCPIGYSVEAVPQLNDHGFTLMVAEDGTVLGAGRLYRSDVGVFDPLPGFVPQCINGNGLMVGNLVGSGAAGVSVATEGGVIATFPKPAGSLHIYAWGMSETGYIAGNVAFADGTGTRYVPFRITPDLRFELLSTPNGESATVNAVNSSGQVCGNWQGPFPQRSAFWDSDGTFHAVPIPADWSNNESIDINDNGEVLLFTTGATPAIWSVDDGLRYLSSSGLDSGFASWAMNHLGHVTGDLIVGTPWVWIDGTYSFLQQSMVNGDGWELLFIRDINDAGQIVGMARFNGTMTAFLLTPVGLCAADVTTTGSAPGALGDGVPDGATTASDLQYFVNAWVAFDAEADLTTRNAPEGGPGYGEPDGVVSAVDIQYYVNLWVNGCE